MKIKSSLSFFGAIGLAVSAVSVSIRDGANEAKISLLATSTGM